MKNYLPFQQRVIDEKAALQEKINALYVFFTTDTFDELPCDDRMLLNAQYHAMNTYASILETRIRKF